MDVNKIQLNLSVRRGGPTGTIIEKNLLANVRTNTIDEAMSLYASLKERLAELRDDDDTTFPVIEKPVNHVETELVGTRDCERCGSDMVLRTAKTGVFAGSSFYGCANYPKCKAIVRV